MAETPPLLPYSRQWIDQDDVQAVAAALTSDFLTTGPLVHRFEEALAAVTGGRYVAALSSGTAALHAAYAAIGLGPGDEIITSPLTFAATGNAALYLGARPVFADIEPRYGTIDPKAVAALIGPRTRAIVAIDYAGQPADYDQLRALAVAHGLALISDAAHSLGAAWRGRPVGTLADLTALSFHPVKQITTGEGGAVTGNDPELHDRVVAFRTHGIVRDPARFRRDEGAWYAEMQQLGFNYRLTDIQSALGISQLAKLTRFVARRREIAAAYTEQLADVPELRLPDTREGAEPAWHLYVIRLARAPERRRTVFERLRASGIGVQVHFLPVYRHPYYEDLGYTAGLCPEAEDFYSRCLSIPLFPAMTEEDVDRVVRVVRTLVREVIA
jgi:perosamine synthetase